MPAQVTPGGFVGQLLMLCAGDSGSPLLWVDDLQRWSVVGVVSFGPSVCGQQVPGAYTKVESYMDFIKNIIS